MASACSPVIAHAPLLSSTNPSRSRMEMSQSRRRRLRRTSKQLNKNRRDSNIMKTNYLSAPVTDLDTSLVTMAAWDSRSRAISLMETKRTKVRRVGFAFLLAAFLGSCATTELRAQVIVVPNALATNDGNTFGTSPTGGPTSVRENFSNDGIFRSGEGFVGRQLNRPRLHEN